MRREKEQALFARDSECEELVIWCIWMWMYASVYVCM
jgi:hypothetical protein